MKVFDFVEMRIPAKAEYVGVVRLSVSGIASRMGFNYDEIEDLKIAISEAITNTVKHAYDEAETGEVNIGFGIYRNRLEIMVSDHGESFKFEDIKEKIGPYQSRESIMTLREGGFGLFLIEALMDKVEINNDYGVLILMTKFKHETEVDEDGNEISATSISLD